MKHVLLIITLFVTVHGFSQDTVKTESPLNFGVDFYNRFVWRGLEIDNAPCIQPHISLSWRGLSFTTYGSYAVSKDFAEVDLMLSYTWKTITVGVNDYYNPRINGTVNDYSIWTDTVTPHLVEAYATYGLPFEKFPLKFTASTFVYGADRDTSNISKPGYSTYLEAAYPFKLGEYDVNLFLGATVHGYFYASEPSFVNVGANVARTIKVTEKFKIPINGSLVLNPKHRNIFLVVGFSF